MAPVTSTTVDMFRAVVSEKDMAGGIESAGPFLRKLPSDCGALNDVTTACLVWYERNNAGGARG